MFTHVYWYYKKLFNNDGMEQLGSNKHVIWELG